MSSPDPRSAPSQAQWFAPTRWSVVLAAGGNSAGATKEALEKLCQHYWPPLYAYIRRQGFSPHDAQDLTQDFFAWFLESDHLRVASPELGKFRSFLLVRLKHFLSNERKKTRAQKRGGGQMNLSLQADLVEGDSREPSAPDLTPDHAFDLRWVLTILDRSVARLRQEYTEANRSDLFEALKGAPVPGKGAPSYAETAAALGLTESAVKSAAYRLRQRHHQLLREEILQTVAAPGDVDEELRYLMSVLSR